MKKALVFGVFFAFVVVSMIIFHEFVHALLNGFRVSSFCFLNCNFVLDNFTGIFPPIAAVFLEEPINPLAANEFVVHSISFVFGFLLLKFGIKRLKL